MADAVQAELTSIMETQSSFRRHNQPATSAEYPKIQLIIAKQQESLRILQENENHFQSMLQEAKDGIKTQYDLIHKAKLRFNVAISLYESLKESKEKVLALGLNEKDQAQSEMRPISQKLKIEVEDLNSLLQERDHAAAQLDCLVETAELSLRKASEAVSTASMGLQGLLQLEAISEESLKLCSTQALQTQSSLSTKLDLFRAIWRVPDDIWIQIFQIVTNDDFDIYSEDAWNKAVSADGPWSHLTRLLGACYSWRRIFYETPSLWQSPIIFVDRETGGLGEVSNIYSKHSKAITRLTVTTWGKRFAGSSLFVSSPFLSQIRSVRSIRINLTALTGHTIEEYLEKRMLPSFEELYVADFYGGKTTFTVPGHICPHIRKSTTGAFWPTFDDITPSLEELHIRVPQGLSVETSLLHKLLGKNGKHIRLLDLIGGIKVDTRPPILAQDALDQVVEISTTFDTLVYHLGQHYSLSSIRRINVAFPLGVALSAWDQFLSSSNHAANIQEVSIPSADEADILPLIPYIKRLKGLKILEIHGDSVEPFFEAQVHKTEPPVDEDDSLAYKGMKLEKLILISYLGMGDIIKEWLDMVKAIQFSLNMGNDGDAVGDMGAPMIDVVLFDCPNVSLDTQRAFGQDLR